jgi:hypothetical protein
MLPLTVESDKRYTPVEVENFKYLIFIKTNAD